MSNGRAGLSWDFEPLFTMPIDPEFERLINTYLEDVLQDPAHHKGWKIPETTLSLSMDNSDVS